MRCIKFPRARYTFNFPTHTLYDHYKNGIQIMDGFLSSSSSKDRGMLAMCLKGTDDTPVLFSLLPKDIIAQHQKDCNCTRMTLKTGTNNSMSCLLFRAANGGFTLIHQREQQLWYIKPHQLLCHQSPTAIAAISSRPQSRQCMSFGSCCSQQSDETRASLPMPTGTRNKP